MYPGSPLLGYFERRGIACHVDGYRVYYQFQDPRVGRLYDEMRTTLAPFRQIEALCEAARFAAARNNVFKENNSVLHTCTKRLSMSLVDTAYRCLAEVRRAGVESHFAEVRAAAAEQAAELGEMVCKYMANNCMEGGEDNERHS